MKKKTTILILLFLCFSGFSYGQDTISVTPPIRGDSILIKDAIPVLNDSITLASDSITLISDSIPSFSSDSISPISPDSTLHNPDDASRLNKRASYIPKVVTIDTTQKINYWRITERTGEIIPVRADTFLTDYFNRTNVEGYGVSVAYLGNLGLPAESRIFFEREDRSDFLFSDFFRYYMKQPDKFNFINTKIPHSNVTYLSAGSNANKEERLQALLSINLGKQLNIGTFVDYLYARGFYNAQGAKHTDWVFFGNYLSDRHQVHLFLNPSSSYTNEENGGLQNDEYVTHPEYVGSRGTQTKNFPTIIEKAWNQTAGNRYFLNYRYNLGFERETELIDAEGNEIKQFIPVSSIIYTFDYSDRKHRFYSNDSSSINKYYNYADFLNPDRKKSLPSDSTLFHSIKNTLALSLREGFSDWAKFDLTAFITHDIRQFTLMDTVSVIKDSVLSYSSYIANQYATYIGGELSNRTGKIFRYNAQGSLGIVGYNLGDLHLSGKVETRIPLLKDTASISAFGSIKNLSPVFYENHYHSQYFRWNNHFDKIRKVRFGGQITIPHTMSELGLDVENITNYIYFDETGYPKQYDGNIQVLALKLQQNFQLKSLHWDNQVVYQTSSNQNILPLPAISAYSSLFLQFVVSKVLTVQMGVNAHFWSRYYSPTYEPATQQFKLQHTAKTGDYPLLSGYLNCHLKQTRFFLQYYNLGAMFIKPPDYFSIPHYPVNPPLLKLGLSVDFIN